MIQILSADGSPFTERDVDATGRNFAYAQGLLKLSGNYTSGGDTVDFTTIPGLPFSQCLALFAAGQSMGNAYLGVPGSAMNAAKLKVSALGNANAEHAATAYEAGFTGDTIAFEATFRKF